MSSAATSSVAEPKVSLGKRLRWVGYIKQKHAHLLQRFHVDEKPTWPSLEVMNTWYKRKWALEYCLLREKLRALEKRPELLCEIWKTSESKYCICGARLVSKPTELRVFAFVKSRRHPVLEVEPCTLSGFGHTVELAEFSAENVSSRACLSVDSGRVKETSMQSATQHDA